MSKARYDLAPYADVEIPTYREYHPSEPTGDTSGWSLVVVTANVLLALILIVGMLWEGRSVFVSIVTGGLYYAITTLGVIALSSGQAGAMWRTWQQERTERHRIDAYEYLAERRLELEQPRVLPAATPQTPSAKLSDPAPSYVPAYDADAIDQARRWALRLYGRDGQIDPRRVRSGYVQGGVVGSKRSGGSPDAKRLLIDQRVLKPVAGGHKYNVRRYPTTADVELLFASLQGRGGVVGGWDTQG